MNSKPKYHTYRKENAILKFFKRKTDRLIPVIKNPTISGIKVIADDKTGLAKDIEPIVHYIIDNSNAKVIITTNGSIRKEDFYKRLGKYCGRRLSMVIDVDGVDEQMHQKYRRGTSLKKSLSALKALSTTSAIPLSQTVLFKHNEMYEKKIKKLAIKNGSKNHISYPSDRFDGHIFNFINENGEADTLERAVHAKNYM